MKEIPQTIAGYEIDELLGEGGMGQVFLAHDSVSKRKVAIKLISPSLVHLGQEVMYRFTRELEACKSFAHAHLVKIIDGGKDKDSGAPFLVMEYLSGQSLEDILTSRYLTEKEAQRIAEQMAEAFSYYHPQGLVHRDIKPGNIFIEKDGRTVLLDFGLVFVEKRTRLTATNHIVGTPAVMPIEQIRGEDFGPSTDIYQLGVTLYWALTGKPPFDYLELFGNEKITAETYRVNCKNLQRARVSKSFAEIILRCLAFEKEDRFQSGAELTRALQAIHEEREPVAAISIPAKVQRPSKEYKGNKKSPLRYLPILLLLLVALFLFLQLQKPSSSAKEPAKEKLAPGAIVGDICVYPWRGGADIDWTCTPNGGGELHIEGEVIQPHKVCRKQGLVHCSVRWQGGDRGLVKGLVKTNAESRAFQFIPRERQVIENPWTSRPAFTKKKLIDVYPKFTPALKKQLEENGRIWFHSLLKKKEVDPGARLNAGPLLQDDYLVIGDYAGELSCYRLASKDDFAVDGRLWQGQYLPLVARYSDFAFNYCAVCKLKFSGGKLFAYFRREHMDEFRHSVAFDEQLNSRFLSECGTYLKELYGDEKYLMYKDELALFSWPPEKGAWQRLAAIAPKRCRDGRPFGLSISLSNGSDGKKSFLVTHHKHRMVGADEIRSFDENTLSFGRELSELQLGYLRFAPQYHAGLLFFNTSKRFSDGKEIGSSRFVMVNPDKTSERFEFKTRSRLHYSNVFLDKERQLVTFCDETTIYCLNFAVRKGALLQGPIIQNARVPHGQNEFSITVDDVGRQLGITQRKYSSFLTTPVLLSRGKDGAERIITVIASRAVKMGAGLDKLDELQGLAYLLMLELKDGKMKVRKLSSMLTVDGGFNRLRHHLRVDTENNLIAYTLSENLWVLKKEECKEAVLLHHRPAEAVSRLGFRKNHIYYATKSVPLMCVAFSPLYLN